jgi:phage/plasmid-like protein (TIGR03299 family)
MSKESQTWLENNILVGFTAKRGEAWWSRGVSREDGTPNHFEGAIPVETVKTKLFDWTAVARRVAVEKPATLENMTHFGDNGEPLRWAVQADRQAIDTSDTAETMGFFKSGYRAHQYQEWLLGNVATILDDELQISSAGLLRNRAQAWVEVSMPETMMGPAGIAFRPNLLACTSFDGTLATTTKRTITAVVCDNTLHAALGTGGGTFKVRHSKNSGMKIAKAREALGIVYNLADEFTAALEGLTAQKISPIQFRTVLDALVPVDDSMAKMTITKANAKRDKLSAMYLHDPRVAPWAGTGFGVLQAFNTYEQHERGLNKATIRAERNMLDTLSGASERADAEVLEVLAAL